MTKAKDKPQDAVSAVTIALRREQEKRPAGLKPIEIVKTAVCAYQAYHFADGGNAPDKPESPDRAGLARGKQSSVDRLLFNVNYWLSAYEDRIVGACPDEPAAQALLKSIATWNSHTMKLNTLSSEEAVALFERFCPPLATNNRRGDASRNRAGKGPVNDFARCVRDLSGRLPESQAHRLAAIAESVEDEARFYDELQGQSALDALYDLLPAWCLQDEIDLVRAPWWNDADVMALIAERMHDRFLELGYARPLCDYHFDAMRESIDNYTRTLTTEISSYLRTPMGQLVETIRKARVSHPDFETDGYGPELPLWLDSKEQLIWNTVVCAIYGPMNARPLLSDDLSKLPLEGRPQNVDVITELAQHAYLHYVATRRKGGTAPEYDTFEGQPADLRNSGLERIESIPRMLDVLGYRIVPAASCYPDQRIEELRESEVECLAILEHRRWFEERTAAGWRRSPDKDVDRKLSPYLVDWDDLPEQAREWNRSTARQIPSLLAGVGLAIAR